MRVFFGCCYLVILRQIIHILPIWEVVAQFSILFSAKKHSPPSAAKSSLVLCELWLQVQTIGRSMQPPRNMAGGGHDILGTGAGRSLKK